MASESLNLQLRESYETQSKAQSLDHSRRQVLNFLETILIETTSAEAEQEKSKFLDQVYSQLKLKREQSELEKAKINAKNIELKNKVVAVVDYLDKVEAIDTDNRQLKEVKEGLKQILDKKEIEDKVQAVKEYISKVETLKTES